ncbi:benzoate/H(+) symporter BenE family transporter [Salmonella enterica subsp. enterica]|nr:benzoate/H(+) symporter BenE family transporter [Salmonella enterica subsp. enterica]
MHFPPVRPSRRYNAQCYIDGRYITRRGDHASVITAVTYCIWSGRRSGRLHAVSPPLSAGGACRWRNTRRIASWMTALGIIAGAILTLTLWYRAPVFGLLVRRGALLTAGLQGIIVARRREYSLSPMPDCAVRRHGIVARLMDKSHLSYACWRECYLSCGCHGRSGTLNGEFVMCGGHTVAWLLFKVFAPALCRCRILGITVALIGVELAMSGIHFAPVWPTFVSPRFSFAQSCGVIRYRFFTVTMASQSTASPQ